MYKSCILLWAGILLAVSSCTRKVDKATSVYKNIVVIVGDDHGITTLGALGNQQINTPNLNQLASDGARFTNAYANSPICSASRQSVLSGKYPHASGVTLLFTPFNDEMNYTIAEHLKTDGYKTCLIGKTHFNDWLYWNYWEEWPDYGFDTMISSGDYKNWLKAATMPVLPDTIKTRSDKPEGVDDVLWGKNAFVLPEAVYDDFAEGTWFAKQAIDFLSQDGEKKFLWLAFHEPHAPFSFPVEYAGRYKPEDMVLPETSAQDDRWVPTIFRDLNEDQRKGIIAAYYTSVEYMDKNIGLVLNAIREKGLEDETLIIYFGDQGYLLNEHKRFEKHTMWEESIKTPLIIKGNGKIASSKEYDALVELIDIGPTIFEAAGLPVPDEYQGKSLSNLLTGEDTTHKKFVYAEFLEDNILMVANKEWKYVFTAGIRDLGLAYATGFGPSGVSHFLYNLKTDPKELNNVASNPENKAILGQLRAEMLENLMKTHPEANNCPSGLNTTGKLIWFSHARDVGAEPGLSIQRLFDNPDSLYQLPKELE